MYRNICPRGIVHILPNSYTEGEWEGRRERNFQNVYIINCVPIFGIHGSHEFYCNNYKFFINYSRIDLQHEIVDELVFLTQILFFFFGLGRGECTVLCIFQRGDCGKE